MSELVDSSAMHAAFDEWRSANPDMAQELGLVDGLPTIVHNTVFPTLDMIIPIPCPRGMSCDRCGTGRAGYTFRWFSCLWLDDYKRFRKDGTWLPGDPEGHRAMRDAAGFVGEILNSRGELVPED